eukprot:598337_1
MNAKTVVNIQLFINMATAYVSVNAVTRQSAKHVRHCVVCVAIFCRSCTKAFCKTCGACNECSSDVEERSCVECYKHGMFCGECFNACASCGYSGLCRSCGNLQLNRRQWKQVFEEGIVEQFEMNDKYLVKCSFCHDSVRACSECGAMTDRTDMIQMNREPGIQLLCKACDLSESIKNVVHDGYAVQSSDWQNSSF